MQASEKKIIDFLAEDNELKLPIYQRNYEWDIFNCQKLIEDILQNDNYFLGLIVTCDNKKNKFLVDGQQRTTTMYLLLVALREIFFKLNIPVSILEKYLYLEDSPFDPTPETDRIKIKLLESDYEELKKIVSREILQEKINTSPILNNYEFIYDYLDSYFSELSNNEIPLYKREVGIFLEKIRKIEIVELRLFEGEDSPQQIFESLNSSGLKLNAAELIKNHILMYLDYENQAYIHNKYWEELERKIGINNLSDFFRFYLTYKNKTYVQQNQIYNIFKKFFDYEKDNYGLELILDDILFFAQIYMNLKTKTDNNERVSEFLKIIDRVGSTVFYVFYFHISFLRHLEHLTEEDFIQILNLTESYFIRRYICELTSQSAEAMFLEAIKLDTEDLLNNYVSFLNSKDNTHNRFPSDEEFKRYFNRSNLLSQREFTTKYILYRIENSNRKEKVNLNNIHLGHIFPKELVSNKYWKLELGESFSELHNRYLNSISNIFISLEPIPKKHLSANFKNKKEGILNDKLFINRDVCSYDIWNEENIQKHSNYLFNIAKQVWAEI